LNEGEPRRNATKINAQIPGTPSLKGSRPVQRAKPADNKGRPSSAKYFTMAKDALRTWVLSSQPQQGVGSELAVKKRCGRTFL